MSYYYMYRRMGRGAMLMSAGAALLVMIYIRCWLMVPLCREITPGHGSQGLTPRPETQPSREL
jgi:hypothetical protein